MAYGVFTPWRHAGANANRSFTMKALYQNKYSHPRIERAALTLGELIAKTYSAYGEKEAPGILHLAMQAQVIRNSRPQSLSYPRGASRQIDDDLRDDRSRPAAKLSGSRSRVGAPRRRCGRAPSDRAATRP